MTHPIPIAVAYGDGIGPEIMEATLHILQEAGAFLEIHPIEIGEKVYLKGYKTGIEPSTWDTIRHTKAFLKAPITTPQGGGFKSLNVTIRTSLGLFANVRPCTSYAPFVQTKHPNMDVVIVRENEEDLYTGIEYKQTPDVCTSIKMISYPGSAKIINYAFEYARHHGRKKVTCFTKDNIMKLSDGLFHHTFETIAKSYPDIENEHWIVDIGAAKLADTPEAFDVVVLPNLYGDILSDVAAQISGSVGLAGSANIGDGGAMFEAIHGSAPRRAGQNMANPSGLLLAAIMMLVHLEREEVASRIHNAWLCVLESGAHTYDIFREGTSKRKVGTKEFAELVVKSLGSTPKTLKAPLYKTHPKLQTLKPPPLPTQNRELVGVDIFLYSQHSMATFTKKLQETTLPHPLTLHMITNRGARIWPDGIPETTCIDQWRCRFTHKDPHQPITHQDIINLQTNLIEQGHDIIKLEHLYTFNKHPGYSSSQE